MSKIFDISDLPIAKAFPSLEYGAQNSVLETGGKITEQVPKHNYKIAKRVLKSDTFVKPQSKSFAKKCLICC